MRTRALDSARMMLQAAMAALPPASLVRPPTVRLYCPPCLRA